MPLQCRLGLHCAAWLVAYGIGIRDMHSCRHGPQAGYFKAVNVDEKTNPDGGFSIVFDWSANSKSINEGTTLEFIPPAYNGYALVC